jgi:hypothetical protein
MAPAALAAAERYASSAGDASDPSCPPSDPCDIDTAVEHPSVTDGDTVIVLSDGVYSPSTGVSVSDAITVRGEPGQPFPQLITAGNALSVNVPGAAVRRLHVECTSGSQALNVNGAATLEQLELVARTPCDDAARLSNGALLRDSVAWTDFANGVRTFGSGAVLTNVTTIGVGVASDGVRSDVADGSTQTVILRNVIARGTASDIHAINDGTSGDDNVDVDVAFSNYSSIVEASPDADVVEGPGNQSATPLFANPGPTVLDFHQLSASPTIDAGTASAALGSADIDGEARSQGAAPDIGADEFTVPIAAPPGDNFPPDTGIRKGPKKKTFKRHVKFKFGGSEPGVTFNCQLDAAGWEPCSSPKKYKGLKRGKHVFAVRAVDAAGNPDPTPADRRWKIIKKPKSER